MTVEVLGKPGCGGCIATTRELDAKGIKYQYRDMSTDPDAHAQAVSLGYMQAPVVVTSEDHWSGFRPDKIANLSEKIATAL